MANTVIPQHFLDVLEPVKNNDEEVRKLGVRLVADMCRTILNSDLDIHGIHIYTMNLEKGTRMLLEELNLVPRIESIKPLPWRQVSSRTTDSCIIIDSLLVLDTRSSKRDHPADLLGKPYQIIHRENRKLG